VLKVVDAARDAGLQVGPPAPANYMEAQIQAQQGGMGKMVAFRIPDPAALREQAYKAAMDDAMAKAKRLAALSGGSIGRVISVVDQGAAPTQSSRNVNMYYAMMMGVATGDADETKGLSTDTYGEIPLTVRLTVRFEIAK
jgi:uncharacterized protein YggE